MARMILAVVAGFVGWSILWLGSDQVLRIASPGWYGAHQAEIERAMTNGEPMMADSTIMFIRLFLSVVFSIMAGFLAAVIANENSRTPLWLGVVLLLFGLVVQIAAWSYMPIWYHLIFLALLLPMTMLGGRVRSAT